MNKYVKYLNYLVRHKWFVFLECFKYGLILRGIAHDFSKFYPDEFIPYANHFSGDIKKGRTKTGYYKPTDTGDPAFDMAFFKHQKRNSHHWQYWVLPSGDGNVAIEIPIEDVVEMVCDWRGAGRAQNTPDTMAWYRENRDKLLIHPNSRAIIEDMLGYSGG